MPDTHDDGHLRRLLAAAKSRPWEQGHHVAEPRAVVSVDEPNVSLLGLDLDGMAIFNEEEDAAVAVAAVNALPSLLERVAAAEKERDEARTVLFRSAEVFDQAAGLFRDMGMYENESAARAAANNARHAAKGRGT